MSHPFLKVFHSCLFSDLSLLYSTGVFSYVLFGLFTCSIQQISKWHVGVCKMFRDICMFNEQIFRRALRAKCYEAQGLINTCVLE